MKDQIETKKQIEEVAEMFAKFYIDFISHKNKQIKKKRDEKQK